MTSKTRVKLLTKFLINPNTKSYLRALSSEFGESTNAVRLELNKLEQAGLLFSCTSGNKKMFQANVKHALFQSLQQIVHHYVGIDRIIDRVVSQLGHVDKVYLMGDYAQGNDSGIIDLAIVGKNIDESYLLKLIRNCENLIDRKIRYMIFAESEIKNHAPAMLIWSVDE